MIVYIECGPVYIGCPCRVCHYLALFDVGLTMIGGVKSMVVVVDVP